MNVSSRFLGRVGLVLLAAAAAAQGVSAEERHSEGQHFTARDIKRSYGYSCSGTVAASPVLPPSFLGPFAQIGQVSCDGRDTCSGTSTVSFNGNIFAGTISGPYTVKPNGEGDVTYTVKIPGFPDSLLPIHFVIYLDGRGIKGLPVGAGNIVTCDLKEQ